MDNFPDYGYDYYNYSGPYNDYPEEDQEEYITIIDDELDENGVPISPYTLPIEEPEVPDYSLSYADDYIPEPPPAPFMGPSQNVAFDDEPAVEEAAPSEEQTPGHTGYNFGETLSPYEYDAMGFPSEFGSEMTMYPYGYFPDYDPLYDIKTQEDLLNYLRDQADTRKYASPLLVLGLLLTCFPVGLGVMYFATKWGTFSKILITFFVLAVALAVYELLIIKQVIALPSVMDILRNIWLDLIGEF